MTGSSELVVDKWVVIVTGKYGKNLDKVFANVAGMYLTRAQALAEARKLRRLPAFKAAKGVTVHVSPLYKE